MTNKSSCLVVPLPVLRGELRRQTSRRPGSRERSCPRGSPLLSRENLGCRYRNLACRLSRQEEAWQASWVDFMGVLHNRHLGKRAFLGKGACVGLGIASRTLAAQAEEQERRPSSSVFVRGRCLVTQEGVSIGSQSALYVTARPTGTTNVPRAILDGSNGKPPPVLAARIPLEGKPDSFPLSFSLSDEDLTVEGAASSGEDGHYWFENQDLVVSARLDSDGMAATRDPGDMVGRAQYFAAKDEEVVLQLRGRGIGGRFVTAKAKKKK